MRSFVYCRVSIKEQSIADHYLLENQERRCRDYAKIKKWQIAQCALSRDVRDIYNFLDDVRDAGVAFVSVTEGFDTTTATGRVMLGVATVFAHLTREMISENTKDGLLRRAKFGLYNGGGNRRNGYNYDTERGMLIPHESKAQHIRQISDWFCEHGWGTEKTARMLNLRRGRSKRGKQWTANTISHILRNPVYCGELQVNGSLFRLSTKP